MSSDLVLEGLSAKRRDMLRSSGDVRGSVGPAPGVEGAGDTNGGLPESSRGLGAAMLEAH